MRFTSNLTVQILFRSPISQNLPLLGKNRQKTQSFVNTNFCKIWRAILGGAAIWPARCIKKDT